MRARQTGSYMSFKQDLERALSAAEGTKRPSARLGIASPKTLQNAGNESITTSRSDFTIRIFLEVLLLS